MSKDKSGLGSETIVLHNDFSVIWALDSNTDYIPAGRYRISMQSMINRFINHINI